MDTLARIELPAKSGLAPDTVVNDFVIAQLDSERTAGELASAITALAAFYNADQGAGARLSGFIGPSRSRAANACHIKLYEFDIFDPEAGMGSPYAADVFTLGAGSVATGVPEECACVVTIRGDGWNTALVERADGADEDTKRDRPRQRHTGRIYFGPLGTNAYATDATTGVTRLGIYGDGALGDTLVKAIKKLDQDLRAIGTDPVHPHLGIYSRKDGNVRAVVRSEVDDAFDIQRRRGPAATGRVTLDV